MLSFVIVLCFIVAGAAAFQGRISIGASVIAQGGNATIFTSVDGGHTFTASASIPDLVFDPSLAYSTTSRKYFFSAPGGSLWSKDTRTWIHVPQLKDGGPVAFSPSGRN